ncbi:MAG: MFS transporter [Lewinellaceae bacterium]|nr:MFS transporter [Saprospiraceae bacterium]MCB9337994.1 MFS transporter [Lewinellaceae bacterium]
MNETKTIVRNDPKVINGWAFFDWANSAYALVITVAIFPGYFMSVTDDHFDLLGINMTDSALYAFAVSAAYLLIAVASPFLSGIADYGGRKKWFLRLFTTAGSLACISMYFFTGMSTLPLGTVAFILATIGFAGGLVFYNAYLPLIATEDQYDRVSAKGFSYGYIGSIMLLITNLVIITYYEQLGFREQSMAVRLAFVMVGLWWIGFAQIPFRRLPADRPDPPGANLIKKGFEELKKVWRTLQGLTNTKRFLLSFFFYNAGVQTVLFLASTFAEKELHFATSDLIILILILQLVAILGAQVFARVSDWKGNKVSIMIMLVIWMLICGLAYVIQGKLNFYILAGAVGMVMGGIQSMSRSTYSKLLPENTPDTTSYFSFYDVLDKVSTMIGTFGFGIVQLMGSMRQAIGALSIFFLIGLFILSTVKIAHKKNVQGT